MIFTRRRLLVTAAGLAAAATGAGALSGCNASAGQPAGPAPSGAGGGAEPSAYPVTISHKFGETAIEAEPKRVVTVGLKDQDDCLALGVVPVGSTVWYDLGGSKIIGPWAKAALGENPEPTTLTDTDGMQFEKIAALQPDLILGVYQGMKQADYDKLAAIAPTIAQPKEYEDWGVPWDAEAKIIGQALGRPARMGELVEQAKAKVAAAAAKHPQFTGTGLVASIYQGIFVYGIQDPRPRLLTELGFKLPEGLAGATGGGFGGQLSAERVDLLDTDVLIWFADNVEAEQKFVASNKAYAALPVHQQGRDVFTRPGDGLYEVMSFITVLSLGYLLDRLTPRLVAAVDGDQATKTDPA